MILFFLGGGFVCLSCFSIFVFCCFSFPSFLKASTRPTSIHQARKMSSNLYICVRGIKLSFFSDFVFIRLWNCVDKYGMFCFSLDHNVCMHFS